MGARMALKVYDPLSTASGRALRAVTPSDSDNLPDGPCRSLTATGAGTISVIAVDDDSAQTIYVAQGDRWPIRAKRVRATGTTATGIVAVY